MSEPAAARASERSSVVRPERSGGADQDPLAVGERGKQVDGAHEHVRAGPVERHPPLGLDRRQRVELDPRVARRLLSVDGVDVDEGAVALAAARVACRPGDLVAGAQLAPPHLGGGDVDVALGRGEPLEAQEAIALTGQLEHPGDVLGRQVLVGLLDVVDGVVEDLRLEHDHLVGIGVGVGLVCRGGVGLLGGRSLGARRPRGGLARGSPSSPPAAAARLLGRLGRLGTELLDQFLAAQQPVAGDAGRGGALVKLG